MKIRVVSIEKSTKDEYEPIFIALGTNISRFAEIEMINLFNNQIKNAQARGQKEAQAAYTLALIPKLGNYNIALDINGKNLNSSHAFAELLSNKSEVNFFIGGAFGFEESFLKRCNEIISLSKLTFGHKIAKIVLLEQIFRALAILNNHPYHKEGEK